MGNIGHTILKGPGSTPPKSIGLFSGLLFFHELFTKHNHFRQLLSREHIESRVYMPNCIQIHCYSPQKEDAIQSLSFMANPMTAQAS